MNVRSILATIFLLSCLFVLCYSTVLADDAADLCETPGNLLKNCRFDNGFRGVGGLGSVAQGWCGFVISGRPDFNGISCDSPEPPCQRVWSDGETWEGGIYQQVGNV